MSTHHIHDFALNPELKLPIPLNIQNNKKVVTLNVWISTYTCVDF